jgi:hypothetical protein
MGDDGRQLNNGILFMNQEVVILKDSQPQISQVTQIAG